MTNRLSPKQRVVMARMIKRKIPCTITIIVICVIVHLLILLLPLNISSTDKSILFGAYYKAFVSAGEWWRILTCGFVHVSSVHCLMNMFSLHVMGRAMEPNFGPSRFLGILFGSIIGGSLFLFCTAGNTVGVGLSGGLYGLLAAYLLMVFETGAMRIPQVRNGVIQTLGINLIINFIPGVAWRAHLGGAISGLLIFMAIRKKSPYPGMRRNAIISLVLLVLLSGFAGAKRRFIPEAQRYLLTDYSVLQAEKNLGLDGYAANMAKRLDCLYDINYLYPMIMKEDPYAQTQ